MTKWWCKRFFVWSRVQQTSTYMCTWHAWGDEKHSEGRTSLLPKCVEQNPSFKKKRHSTTIQRFIDSKDKTKRPNKAMVATGIDYTPLLLGKVQLGSIHNDQRELLIEELHVWGTRVDRKERITVLKKLLIDDECKNSSIDPSQRKGFMPRFLVPSIGQKIS